MASFSLPTINDNPDGGWGPSGSNFPEQFKFKDIPYAPYSKADKLGRFADWNELSLGGGDGRAGAAGASGATGTGGRGGRTGTGRRDGPQAFGSGSASAFASFQIEDESNFSIVDNRAGPARRPGQAGRGKPATRGGAANYSSRGGAARGGRGGYGAGRGGAQRGGRRGWRDWEKVCSMLSLWDSHNAYFIVLMFFSPDVLVNPLWRSLQSGRCLMSSSSSVSLNHGLKSTSQKMCTSMFLS
jgi:translation initiation factor 3 subunit D